MAKMESELGILDVDLSPADGAEVPNPLTSMSPTREREYLDALEDVIKAQRAGVEGSATLLVY